MRKIIPYLFIAFGIFILIGSFSEFLRDKDIYRVLLSWHTENKYLFILVKFFIASLFLVTGYQKLKRFKE